MYILIAGMAILTTARAFPYTLRVPSQIVPIEGCNGPLGFICQINATAHQPRMADPSPMPMEYDEDEHSYY
ncbi:hypothetical protein DI09_115p40 [Mitosporidium daphniae]|uniref:Secreted protein n=1 Tax=Mitosporidium daphniae TaxID=1485682 RepID=A0A098VV90_9MICR|nr:uncharacterized protein DI09_115p40 [Mitosporidium daphniae]KGG53038.1 hypothetical protein DI09_115p40 [Mitosporidium daphniae]|eukprot:XP_013239474.1 uncharacterized protein DI09_115p40 [Mitosporidium daphniae]